MRKERVCVGKRTNPIDELDFRKDLVQLQLELIQMLEAAEKDKYK
jgi:hypothetical protein